MSLFPDNSGASAMVTTVWRRNCLPAPEAGEDGEEAPIPIPVLASKVMCLAPRMGARDKASFFSAFTRIWPRIDALRMDDSRYPTSIVETPEDELVLMRWIGTIAARLRPVAPAPRRLIMEGDRVAYPDEFEVMKLSPSDFGDYRLTGMRDDYFRPLRLTHRQLALHVEFAPLLAAVFLASRLPGSFTNGMLMPSLGMRPQVVNLLEVLLARRPDNMTDEQFLPYVYWLLRSRPPLWPDYQRHILG